MYVKATCNDWEWRVGAAEPKTLYHERYSPWNWPSSSIYNIYNVCEYVNI